MKREDLPTGKQFLWSVILAVALYSLPAVVLVLSFVEQLVGMSREMWFTLGIGTGIYVLLGSPVNNIFYRRLMEPITTWLDDPEPDRAASERGFSAIMNFPQRIAAAAALGWNIPSLGIALGMALRHPASWGLWESFVFSLAGISAGGCCAILITYKVRTGHFAEVREALARAVGGPEERQRLAPQVSMRVKAVATVTIATLVPVTLATLIAMRQGELSLERFAIEWTQHVLDSVTTDPEAAADEDWARRSVTNAMPAVVSLQPLDRMASAMSPDVRAEIHNAASSGVRGGNSLMLPTQAVFSWRVAKDGSIWVASISRRDLFAQGTSSTLALATLFLISVSFAGVVSWLLARDITEPAAILREAADRLALGDLSPGRVYESADELGELSRSFDVMTASLRTTIGSLAESADGLERQAGELAPVCRNLSTATKEQIEGTRRAVSSMEEIRSQVAGIASSSQALNESVEESSSSVLELGATGQELNETASVLSAKVEDVSSSIEEMARSVKQISENTETLSAATDQNSSSMEEMASSLRQVDSAAGEAAELSRSVVDRAEIGRAKVRETIAGMDAIREATDTAEEVIRTLHGRAGEIGAIVDVIDDVADETNLLALNAAIIAAQSGEHGRAFSVVAEEIKDLAERVLASTKEIGGLIRSVQEESERATGAIERGSASVASGVDLSAEAGLALEEITEASRQSGARIDGIVAALREQAKAAGHVVELMDSVRDGVEEIRRAAAEQDRGNEVVYQSAQAMRDVAQQVHGATEEQARGSSRIRESIESVRVAVEQINRALQEQSGACNSAADCLEEVQSKSGTHEVSTRTVEGVARELLAQAEALRSEVRRFQV